MTVLGSNPRASVNTDHPDSFGICDLCGFLYSLKDLQWQYDYRGNALTNLRFLRCQPCLDVPFQNNRPIYMPPDPAPVPNARPAPWAAQEGPPPPNVPVTQLIGD